MINADALTVGQVYYVADGKTVVEHTYIGPIPTLPDRQRKFVFIDVTISRTLWPYEVELVNYYETEADAWQQVIDGLTDSLNFARKRHHELTNQQSVNSNQT